ncbi:MAG: hypothetical protein F4X98_14370 [Gammaproteobacteria bacterium]|nr:hypothetical protein [Gammaproteobacteria bacterium]
MYRAQPILGDMVMVDTKWPPEFSLEQERILNLLTGDRFYSNPSAALREAVLNAIDAINRRKAELDDIIPKIRVDFDASNLTVTVSDNGVGMNKDVVTQLFVKVGASAASAEAKKQSVGEFGIGVISYFMAADTFALQTFDGSSESIGLSFSRGMLSGGTANEIAPQRSGQGTTILLHIRDKQTYDILLDNFPHWCRDVAGLTAYSVTDDRELLQPGPSNSAELIGIDLPDWVERAHLGPISSPTGWEAMTGTSIVSVLYRGVFVQEFEVQQLWGIEGTIDVDPKHFKPRLNREGFVEGQFHSDVTTFLQTCHPIILGSLVDQLQSALEKGILSKWTVKRWASLWLSLPRDQAYRETVGKWDSVFRSIPAFELAVGNRWEAISFNQICELKGDIYLAPFSEENPNDVTQAALRLLRNTGRPVIRGIRFDRNWLRHISRTFGTTSELISSVFVDELPKLIPIASNAEQILQDVSLIARLFLGPPPVDLVRIGNDSLPVLRLKNRLIINLDHDAGRQLVEAALKENTGPSSLIAGAAQHTYEQLTQVAAVVREISGGPEILGPIRRQYIRALMK